MNSCALLHRDKLPRILARHRHLIDDAWPLTVTSYLNADRSRIFQALTVPEYIEAWFCLPGDTLRQASVSLIPNGFRIKRYIPVGPEFDVAGSYMLLRRSKMLFTWQRDIARNDPTSFVFIRLEGEFTRTRIRLHHVGLKSVEEQEWHQKMWETSLIRLSALFK